MIFRFIRKIIINNTMLHSSGSSLNNITNHIISLFSTAILFLCIVTGASAATFQVTKSDDSADGACDIDCSLREAVIAANTNPGPDTIELSTLISPFYELTIGGRGEDAAATGDLDILDDLILTTIDGPNAVISANGIDRVFHVFHTVSFTLSYVDVFDGFAQAENGGAMWNAGGNVIIEYSSFSGNTADGYGGAIENRLDVFAGAFYPASPPATMIIRNSILSNNCAYSGGAIENGGTLFIFGSEISFNIPTGSCVSSDAAGIHVQYGDVTINKSAIIYNEGGEGGISNQNGVIEITDSTIAHNTGQPGGFIARGAGIGNWAGSITITNSTIADNHGTHGGAIMNGGGLIRVTNSTIVGNSGSTMGGGIYASNGIFWPDPNFSTLPDPTPRSSEVELVNTIVSENISPSGPDCFTDNFDLSNPDSAIKSLGGNAISLTFDCAVTWQPNDLPDSVIGLSPYIEVGSPPMGHYPLSTGSIAIDAGDNSYCPPTDQLGTVRPQDGNDDNIEICDIGAIEEDGPGPGYVISIMPLPNGYSGGLEWDGTHFWGTDLGSNIVFQFDTSGIITQTFGTPGGRPHGLAWDGSALFVSDYSSRLGDTNPGVIYKMDVTGNVLSSFNTPGGWGLAWDGTSLYQSDYYKDQVWQMDTLGNVINSYNIPSSPCYPCGSSDITFDGTYYYYVNNWDLTGTIYQLDSTGNIISSFTGPVTDASGIAWDGNSLWLSSSSGLYQIMAPQPPAIQDGDNDGVPDGDDNCPNTPNADQADNDADGTGDACDDDIDGDTVLNELDNCPTDANLDQADNDGDGLGDFCDTDDDNDGVLDVDDSCPWEDATGFDADNDGCIDTTSGLTDTLDTLVTEGVIDQTVQVSLTSKVENAEQSVTKDNICAAVNQMDSFKNQIEAQRGKKISDEAADLLIDYADNIISGLLAQLPVGETC